MVTFSDMLLNPQISIHILHSLLSVPAIQISLPPHQYSIYKSLHQYFIVFGAFLFYFVGPTQKQFFPPDM